MRLSEQAQQVILKTAVEHSRIPFALSLSKGERDSGMLTKWVSVRKPFMLRQAQHERLSHVSTAVFRIIRDTVREVFGLEAKVKLFGSRMNDHARGGYIDLLAEPPFVTAEIERKTLQLTGRLQLRIGGQAIDVLVLDPSTPRQPIHEQASMTGIKL